LNVSVDSRYAVLALRNIRGNLEINSNSDRVSAEDIGGFVRLRARASSVRFDEIRGPVDIQDTLKDVVVNNAADSCSITNEYADIRVSARTLGKGDMQIKNRNGAIDVSLPEGASFVMDAIARNGQIRSDYLGLEPARKEGSSSVLKAGVRGGGPKIVLETQYDNIRITGSPVKTNGRQEKEKQKTIAGLNWRLGAS